MQLSPSGRIVFVAQWVLALILPMFVFLGRGLLGAQLGWTAVIGAGYGAIITLLLIVPPILALIDPVARAARSVRGRYAFATVMIWTGAIVAGLSIPDSDDEGFLDSAVSAWFGMPYEVSIVIFGVASGVAMVAWVAAVVFAVQGIRAGRRGE